MPREISGRCIAHPNELASDLCSTCGDEFCGGCLVGTTSSKRSLCVGCALAASGVRATARKRVRPIGARELRKRRDASQLVRREAVAHNTMIDRAHWQVLNGPLAGARAEHERARRDLLEPAVPAHSAVDPELTAAGFTSREAMELPPIDTSVSDRRRIEPLAHVSRRPTPAEASTPVPATTFAPPARVTAPPESAVSPAAEPTPVAAQTDAPARSLARVWTSQGTPGSAPETAAPRPSTATAPAPPWRRRSRAETPSGDIPANAGPVALAPVADLTEAPVVLGSSPWSSPPRPSSATPDGGNDVAGGSYRPSAWAGLTADGHGERSGGAPMPMRTPRFTGSRLS